MQLSFPGSQLCLVVLTLSAPADAFLILLDLSRSCAGTTPRRSWSHLTATTRRAATLMC
jgi:hypothetical protein